MIVFASRTGNVRSVINKLPLIRSVELEEGLKVKEPFFMFTYTDGIGDVPDKVLRFLEANYEYLRGVIASGNTNFGVHYARSAETISKKYQVPIIRRVDLRGNAEDLLIISEAHKIRIEGEIEK